MNPGEAIVSILGVIMTFSIPLTLIGTYHHRKMMEIQLRLKNQGSEGVKTAVEELRQEMRQLRETTMQYDLSFDTALQRMEQRMDSLERRVNQVESAPNELRLGR